ncbi:MAG: hypothetical protein ACTTJ3_02990 [Treponema sp.]
MKKQKEIKEQIVNVNTFDLSDYIIFIHQKKNISLSLCKLQILIFFYQITSKTTHTVPYVDDDFLLKNNFIYLEDIRRKYRKNKKDNLIKLKAYIKPATFTRSGSACRLITKLSEYFENYSDRALKKLIRKTPSYLKYKDKKNTCIKMEKKDYIKYYPLKKWEDVYNMILDIDNKIPLFRL